MTVYIEKPAVNLREELASLRNQGGYQEQQFYFDSLVTNGTFDADTSGWTATSGDTISVVSGQLQITADAAGAGYAYQQISLEIGKTYTASFYHAASSANRYFKIGTAATGGQMLDLQNASIAQDAVTTATFVATAATAYVSAGCFVSQTALFDNISIFETDGTDVIHTMPKGWKPKDVFEDGLLQREGAAHDYEVVYDGFDYFVKPTVAPSATTQTCVIGVKA